jgi:hypothetical protein
MKRNIHVHAWARIIRDDQENIFRMCWWIFMKNEKERQLWKKERKGSDMV